MTAQSTSARFTRWAKLLWAPVVLVAAALIMTVTATAGHGSAFSPTDEWVYYDYVTKIPSQGIVHQGELIGQEAIEDISCDGVVPFGKMGSPCGGDYTNYDVYPQFGKTSADAYTPIYFAITWFIAKIIQIPTGLELLTAARLTGFFWLAGGLLLSLRIAREVGVPKLAAVVTGLLVVVAPFSRWTYSYISTDAPSYLLGAAMLLVAILALKRRNIGWWLVPLAVFAVLIKVTNLLGVGLAILFLLASIFFHRRESKRSQTLGSQPGTGLTNQSGLVPVATDSFVQTSVSRLLVIAGTTTVAAIGVELIWLKIREAIAVGPPPYLEILSSGALPSVRELVNLLWSFAPNTIVTGAGFIPDDGATFTVPGIIFTGVSLLFVAGVIAFGFAPDLSPRMRALATATLISTIMFAPILAVGMSVVGGVQFDIVARYGSALLAAMMLGVAWVIRARFASIAVLVYALGLFVIVVSTAHLYA